MTVMLRAMLTVSTALLINLALNLNHAIANELPADIAHAFDHAKSGVLMALDPSPRPNEKPKFHGWTILKKQRLSIGMKSKS